MIRSNAISTAIWTILLAHINAISYFIATIIFVNPVAVLKERSGRKHR